MKAAGRPKAWDEFGSRYLQVDEAEYQALTSSARSGATGTLTVSIAATAR